MSTLLRGRPRPALTLLFLALPVVIGATCQPVKKTPPPTQVSPAPPGVNPCTTSTVVITAAQLCDWLIQRDAANQTAGGFSNEAASIGNGSLKGGPIGATPAEKFIAENIMGIPVEELVSIAYASLIGGDGNAANAGDRPYLNVYTTFTDPNKFYDCRFDYVPTTGSTTDFITTTFAASDAPTFVKNGTGVNPADCPATLAGMPAGSHLRFFSISIGDTNAGDQGLVGYIDNVKVATTAGTTTYDFEA